MSVLNFALTSNPATFGALRIAAARGGTGVHASKSIAELRELSGFGSKAARRELRARGEMIKGPTRAELEAAKGVRWEGNTRVFPVAAR